MPNQYVRSQQIGGHKKRPSADKNNKPTKQPKKDASERRKAKLKAQKTARKKGRVR